MEWKNRVGWNRSPIQNQSTQHKHAQLWTHPLVRRLLRLDALERARAAQEAHFEDWLWAACRPTSLAKDFYSPSPKGCAWPNETQAHVRWLFEDRLARASAREHFLCRWRGRLSYLHTHQPAPPDKQELRTARLAAGAATSPTDNSPPPAPQPQPHEQAHPPQRKAPLGAIPSSPTTPLAPLSSSPSSAASVASGLVVPGGAGGRRVGSVWGWEEMGVIGMYVWNVQLWGCVFESGKE